MKSKQKVRLLKFGKHFVTATILSAMDRVASRNMGVVKITEVKKELEIR